MHRTEMQCLCGPQEEEEQVGPPWTLRLALPERKTQPSEKIKRTENHLPCVSIEAQELAAWGSIKGQH